MAWNEPGGGNKDPWSGKGGEQGPPDLEEVVRKLQERLGGLFGGKRRGTSSGDDGDGGGRGNGSGGGFPSLPSGIDKRTIGIAAGVLLVIWLASGIYIIEPAERGVVMRFGAYSDTTDPGPHWHIPFPIETVAKVNVDQVSTFSHSAVMLTKDENIVDMELTVQARIDDAANYLFQDQTPDKSLRDATEAVVRTVIGHSKLDYILTEGRGAISVDIQDRTQELMNRYKTGLKITSVNVQPAKPPEQVKDAFDDAIKSPPATRPARSELISAFFRQRRNRLSPNAGRTVTSGFSWFVEMRPSSRLLPNRMCPSSCPRMNRSSASSRRSSALDVTPMSE